jgi:glycosyltransferase involved in cell wall biosynthesis
MPKNPDNIKFSILSLSIPSRIDKFAAQAQKLLGQIGDRQDVEIISLMDNKSLHIYEKRNHMLDIARGDFVAFLDDDDGIADNYVEVIVDNINRNPVADVICFNQNCWINGKHCKVITDIDNPQEDLMPHPTDPMAYKDMLRKPWHWCAWNRNLATSERFVASYSMGGVGQSTEDIDWLNRLYPKVNSAVSIDDYLHIYQYDARQTESFLR